MDGKAVLCFYEMPYLNSSKNLFSFQNTYYHNLDS